MQILRSENQIFLRGRLTALPSFSHGNHGTNYLRLPIAVARLSGAEDQLNVVVRQEQLEGSSLSPGDRIAVWGEVRTFNNKSGVGNRLVISVFARRLALEEGEDENHLELSGTLCKPPSLRSTPLGRTICDMILAVNRRYGRSDYLPCIAWGSLAHHCGAMEVGDALHLEGRLQSRCYTKQLDGRSEERTAFEVSVMSLLPLCNGPAAAQSV